VAIVYVLSLNQNAKLLVFIMEMPECGIYKSVIKLSIFFNYSTFYTPPSPNPNHLSTKQYLPDCPVSHIPLFTKMQDFSSDIYSPLPHPYILRPKRAADNSSFLTLYNGYILNRETLRTKPTL